MNKIKIIDSIFIENNITIKEAISVMKASFVNLFKENSILPLRTSIEIEKDKSSILFMPAYNATNKIAGTKIVSVNKNNISKGLAAIHGLVILFETETGKPIALLDGEKLTALRTGAVSGLATDLLAPKDADSLCLFGAGVQAVTQLSAINEVRDIKKVFIFDIDENKMDDFINRESDKYKFNIHKLKNDSDLIDIDIICTATSSNKSLFNKSSLKKNVHINAVGSFKPTMCELPLDLFEDSIFIVDDINAAINEAGEIVQAIEKGIISKEMVNKTLGGLICKEYLIEKNKRTIFKSVGIATQDISIASFILEKANKTNKITEISL